MFRETHTCEFFGKKYRYVFRLMHCKEPFRLPKIIQWQLQPQKDPCTYGSRTVQDFNLIPCYDSKSPISINIKFYHQQLYYTGPSMSNKGTMKKEILSKFTINSL